MITTLIVPGSQSTLNKGHILVKSKLVINSNLTLELTGPTAQATQPRLEGITGPCIFIELETSHVSITINNRWLSLQCIEAGIVEIGS